jgi:SAM-dependent methyltransferase
MTEQAPIPANPLASRNTGSDWAGARGEKWRDHLAGMEAMLAPVDEPLIRALHLDAPCRIADIGCGGGATTLEIAHRAPAGTVVHGFDISPALIEAARARTRSDDRIVTFAAADVATASAPEQPYDRLVSRFGVMFFEDSPAAFANLVRWLAPGGRFAFAVWGRLADNLWMTSLREAQAEVIDIPPIDPEAAGPFRYAETDKLLTLLDRAGFGDLDVCDWRGTLPIGGGLPATEAAQFVLTSLSYSDLLTEAGDKAREDVRQSLMARFSPHEQDGAVRMDAYVHIFTGARLA